MIRGLGFPIRFVILLWIIFFLDVILVNINLNVFGIVPRTQFGLIGIFTAPLLHGSLEHLISNSIPMIILGMLLFGFYRPIAYTVFLYCYLLTDALVWVIGRPSVHIGASGLIYGIAFFLFFIGFFRRDFLSIILSVIVFFFYGGIFLGMIPGDQHISWESHLMGACVGSWCAFHFGKRRM